MGAYSYWREYHMREAHCGRKVPVLVANPGRPEDIGHTCVCLPFSIAVTRWAPRSAFRMSVMGGGGGGGGGSCSRSGSAVSSGGPEGPAVSSAASALPSVAGADVSSAASGPPSNIAQRANATTRLRMSTYPVADPRATAASSSILHL